MAMLLFPFSKSSGGARRALRTSARASALIAAALIALMFSGQAWGQRMTNGLLGAGNIIPADANDAFDGQVPESATLPTGLTDYTDNATVDSNNNGFLDSGLDVVDWVLVQVRVVADGAGAPTAAAFCNNNPCPMKAALLTRDGRVSDVDEDGNLGGLVVFEELDFDDQSQDLYIAVFHRTHVPVLSGADGSGNSVGTVDDDGVYVYNLDEVANIANSGAAKAIVGVAGKVALLGGNADSNAAINAFDYREAASVLGSSDPSALYSGANQDFNLAINAFDYRVAAGNLALGQFIQFFATN